MIKAADKLQKPIVLLVEDDPSVRRSLQLVLQGSGFQVRSHATGAALLADPNVGSAHAIVADYRLPDGDGVRLLQDLRKAGFRGQAILVTGFSSPELEIGARAAGYARMLEKPLADRVLRETMAGLFS